MKSDEIIDAVEGVETAVLDDAKKARGWLKSAWAWAWNTSWKTKAVVGVIALTGLLCGMASAYRSPAPIYVTRSEASVMLSARTTSLQSSLDSMSRRMDTMEAGQHQLDSRIKVLEKPAPAKITTGSISKKTPVRRRVRKPASSSNWFDLP